MSIITGKQNVLNIYKEAEEKAWVIPCFCSENLTTTEAILDATREYGEEIGIDNLPITIAITCQYDHRSQAVNYTHTKRWDTGLKLFYKDLELLAGEGGPYEKLRVMVHLDHIQFDHDMELLNSDLSAYSSIMYDASRLPFEQNMEYTARFVKNSGHVLLVEGACDEIVDAEGSEKSEFTTSEKAERYLKATGVDLIVANLGSEHRASAKDLKYRDDFAKKIKAIIGTKIVLHGASSVPSEQIEHLIDDGVCKVNIWTALERDAVPTLFSRMIENASKVVGEKAVRELQEAGLLGEKCLNFGKASLDYFTTVFRQDIIFDEMKKIVTAYLKLWYK